MNPPAGFAAPMAPRPWAPPLPPPLPPPNSSFWTAENVRDRLKDLHETVNLAKAIQKELEMIIAIKEREEAKGADENDQSDITVDSFCKFISDNRIDLEFQEPKLLEAANAIMSKLRFQLEPFRVVTDEKSPWEEKSAAVRLANKVQKYKRNKLWRKRKRRRVAEKIAKEREQYDRIDKEADEWRAREIAKDIANCRVEEMKEIAKLKAKDERKRLESELELILIVEKLQELRGIRIQKLKKQGHFLPEEDDKFLEQVRVAVEEEERLAKAAADTDTAKEAIAIAEESRKNTQNQGVESSEVESVGGVDEGKQILTTEGRNKTGSSELMAEHSAEQGSEAPGSGSAYDSVANLPLEFYHYYHGSNTDIGTLIEVRRTWDAYIRPGRSRIPGHWVEPPPPADEIWASYLVKGK